MIALICIFAALIAEHFLFDALYPINRSSLYLYPIILLAFLLNIEPVKKKILRILVIASSVSFVAVNIPFYNFKKTMTWWEDRDIKEAMLLIKNDITDQSIHTIECTWIYEPIINYYRLEYQVPVQEVFRGGETFQSEYILSQTARVEIKEYTILKDYSLKSGLVLYKRNPSAAN